MLAHTRIANTGCSHHSGLSCYNAYWLRTNYLQIQIGNFWTKCKGVSGYIMERLSVDHHGQRIWRVLISTYQSILCHWQLQVVDAVAPLLPHFCIVFIYCWTCYCPKYTWNICRL